MNDPTYADAAIFRVGSTVGAFYRGLREAGLEPWEAIELTRTYINSLFPGVQSPLQADTEEPPEKE